MRIINGINDFKKLLDITSSADRLEFWDNTYMKKYESIMTHQLVNLYHADCSIFHQFLKELDTDEVKASIEKIDTNLICTIESVIKAATSELLFDDDFDVYLMVGFGHVMGTSGFGERPFVYLGLENLLDIRIDIEYLIAHEVNHMVRIATVEVYQNKLGMGGLSFGDVMILEGLGVVNSVVFDTGSIEFNQELFRKSLMISNEFYSCLEGDEEILKKKMLAKWNDNMSAEDWFEYFIVNGEEDVMGAGYYIGGKMIYEILSRGIAMTELTSLSSGEIHDEYIGLEKLI